MNNFPSSILNDTTYREPEPQDKHMTPSQRRAWRQYVALDRVRHTAFIAQYLAERMTDESFYAYLQRKFMEQMQENSFRMFDTLKQR